MTPTACAAVSGAAGPGNTHWRAFAFRGRGGAVPAVRGHGAGQAERGPAVVFFVRTGERPRRPERLWKLPGQLSAADCAAQSIRQPAGGSAKPLSGMGPGATAHEIPDRAGGGISHRISVLRDRRRAELRRRAEPEPVPAFPVGGFQGLEGLPGESEIRGPAVGEQLQSDQPFQSGGGSPEHRGSGVWVVFRASGAQVYGGLRCAVLRGRTNETKRSKIG